MKPHIFMVLFLLSSLLPNHSRAECDTALVIKEGNKIGVVFNQKKKGFLSSLIVGSAVNAGIDIGKDYSKSAEQWMKHESWGDRLTPGGQDAVKMASKTVIDLTSNEITRREIAGNKITKAKSKDLDHEERLNAALGEWEYQSVFVDDFTKKLNSKYKNICAIIKNPSEKKFPKVSREFYKKGKVYYTKNAAVYDYTSLEKIGVKNVIEVTLPGTITTLSAFDKPRSSINATLRLIDLQEKGIQVSKHYEAMSSNKMSLEETINDGGEILKVGFEALAVKISSDFSKRLK